MLGLLLSSRRQSKSLTWVQLHSTLAIVSHTIVLVGKSGFLNGLIVLNYCAFGICQTVLQLARLCPASLISWSPPLTLFLRLKMMILNLFSNALWALLYT